MSYKMVDMEKDVTDKKDNAADEPVVIADECGDTLWDAVLEQDAKASQTNGSKRFDALLKEIHLVKIAVKEKFNKYQQTAIQPNHKPDQ